MKNNTAKSCFKCGETKPLTEFYTHSRMGDGRLNKCKDCTKRDVRQHRQENPEKVRAYDNGRAKQPHRVAYRDAYRIAYGIHSSEKRKAHQAVNNAIRDGRLTKRPCAFCGTAEPVEAHHHDYSKPLDVTWLCKPCHRRFHALERMATYREGKAA